MSETAIAGKKLVARAVSVAQGWADIGLTEAVGNNRGAQIDKIEALFGLQGEPWCAMFVAFCYAKALCFELNLPTDDATLKRMLRLLHAYFKPSPSCGEIWRDAKSRGIWHEGVSGIQTGDLALFDFDHTGAPGHVGICLQAISGGVRTIEGNTSPGNDGSQAEGQGVYRRDRVASIVLGYVRINR